MNTKRVYSYECGHRKRLKEKFLRSTENRDVNLPDYELMELALFFCIPRKDVKPIAKELLHQFGSIQNIFNAEYNQLLEISGVTDNVFLYLQMIANINNRFLKDSIYKKNIISSWSCLIDYLQSVMGSESIEQFRILLLNQRNILIADIIASIGTFNKTAVYPREIIKKALYYNASAVILVHNHPSGNVQPSKDDINLTNTLIQACKIFELTVHDHLIISNSAVFSFKSQGLI